MAKKQGVPLETGVEVVEELHETVNDDSVEFADVTGKDDLPADVVDPNDEAADGEPASKPAKKAAKKPVATADDDVPAELKGKSPAELAKMYRDAQSVIGRQGTELGELRKIADNYIRTNLKPAAPKAPAKEEKNPDAVDFFTNPHETIAAAVANHPAVKALEGAHKERVAREMTQMRTDNLNKFNAAHPDAGEIVADPEFRAWISKSPIRQGLLLRAHQHYDLAAGMDIFDTWKELKALRTKPADEPAKPKLKTPAGKDAARVPTGGNPTPRSSGVGKEGKIYRRADLIRLNSDDPDRYALMADEITKAYQEGRVR